MTFPDAGERSLVRECWCDLDGHRMRYLRGGSGPALVLIHGLLGWSFSWRHNLPELSRYYTVYAPDLLGIGGSDRAPELDVSLEAIAQRMLRFVDQMGLTSCDLVGTSHGGAVTILMAALQPQRFRSLVLVDAANPWSSHGRLITRVLATGWGRALFKAVFPLSRRFGNRMWIARMYGDTRKLTPHTLQGYAAPLYVPGTAEYGLAIVRTWHRDLELLKTVIPKLADIPTLLIWGSRDKTVYPSSAEAIRNLLPQAELQLIEGAAHLPYEECPEAFNRVLLEFLGRVRASSAGAGHPAAVRVR